jgi:hypothetical protein
MGNSVMKFTIFCVLHPLEAGYIQGNRGYYFSLEAALRDFCQEKGISLALLDRLIFNFSSLNFRDFLIDNPNFPQKSG